MTELRAARIRAGHPQIAVARFVGVSQVAVHQWETGKHAPSPEKRRRIEEYVERVREGRPL